MAATSPAGSTSAKDPLFGAWALHAAHLAPSPAGTEYEQLVAELDGMFGEALAGSDVVADSYGSPSAHFYMDIGSPLVPDQGVRILLAAPGTVIPILECLRSVTHVRNGSPLSKLTLFLQASTKAAMARIQSSRVLVGALGTALLGRIVCVTGTVVRMTSPKPSCISMPFQCAACQSTIVVAVNGTLDFPIRCSSDKCRSQSFIPRPDESVCIDAQTIRLQESLVFQGDASRDESAAASGSASGGMAALVDVLLTGALMQRANVGDIVTVVGVLSSRRAAGGRKVGAIGQQLCLLARAVELNSANSSITLASATQPDAVPAQHLSMYRAWAATPGWFQRLVDSMCPAIYGHSLPKTALLLALLGGSDKPHVRANIHVLLVGDPGIGKSQMLRAAAACSHRSAYVSANTSSSCGLTLSVTRDSSSETTFEPGAVVHGDGGITCIDEIDKATQEHRALLEVMEQQTLSIAKAGLIFSLPVRTSIIAAGNPVGGRFNPLRSLSENTNLSWPLLSRFDFILLLEDSAGDGAEMKMTDHVMRLHRGSDGPHRAPSRAAVDSSDTTIRLLSSSDVASFVAFARQECAPTLADEAKEVIKAWYLAARARREGNDLPVTVRLLQSLVRAAEARAKAELSPTVTAVHAEEAIEVIQRGRASRLTTHSTTAVPLTSSVRKGGKLSLRDQVAQRLSVVMAAGGRSVISHAELVNICSELGAPKPEVLIEQLNSFGVVLQQAGNKYRLSGKPI